MEKLDFERMFGRIFLTLLSAAITFIIADKLSIHFLKPRRSLFEQKIKMEVVRKPKPYVMHGGKPNAEMWAIKLNEMGYPGDAPTLNKTKGELRIMMLGGSAVFKGNPPLPRLVQYQFELNNCWKVKVYNFGVVSSVTGMELARLIFEVVDYHPDIVISFSGFNDIDQPFDGDPRPGYPFNYFVYENNPILDSNIRQYPLMPLMFYGSNILRHGLSDYFLKKFVPLDALREQVGYRRAEWEKAIADIYVKNLIKSHKISKAFGAEFIAVFQPALYFKNMSEKEKTLIASDRKNNSVSILDKILKKIRQLSPDEQFTFVDMSGFFADYPQTVFEDRVHTNQLYRPDLAKGVYAYLKEFIKTRMSFKELESTCPDVFHE